MNASHHWANEDNTLFYEHSSDILKDWAEQGGLASWPDLIAIESYLDRADSILELGSGYGRVLSYLTQHHKNKRISAIEKSNQLFNLLTIQFKHDVQLHHCDIADFSSMQRFDLILWLWSGFTDFSRHEQLPILQHIQPFLTLKGKIIIETFPHDLPPANGQLLEAQNYKLTANDLALHGYIPSPDEMAAYARDSALHLEKVIDYTTTSKRHRKLYVLHSNL